MKKSAPVFIGIGTNLGNRMENINRAYSLIELYAGKIAVKSSVHISPPWGFEADQDFYNTVVELETQLNPAELINMLKKIEAEMGRVKTKKQGYESRLIDLDIIDFGAEVLISDTVILPHPNLHRRAFVLLPLREICPLWVHPVSGKNIDLLINQLDPAETAEKLDNTNV